MNSNRDGKPEGKGEDEWEFTAVGSKIQLEKAKEPPKPHKRDKIITKQKKDQSLVLDEGAVPRTKTRSAMALEIQGNKEDELKDVFSLASYIKRAIAFVFDLAFLAALAYIARLTSPLVRMLVELFMDRYKFKFHIAESDVMNAITGVNGVFLVFFLVIIPVAFFNTSLGKKIMGIRIRGTEKYTLTITEAFKREVILKPLSIALIAGFITPFFSKKRQSIHDMLAKTIVIEE